MSLENTLQKFGDAYKQHLLQIKLQTYDFAYKQYLEEVEQVVAPVRELYRQYTEKYAANCNYTIPDIRVVNMVISTFIDDINVAALKKDESTEYYPKRFPGFVFRLQHPKATMLLFKTGKVIVTGIKEKINATKAIDIFSKRFHIDQQIYLDVQNLVISVDFNYNIELEEVGNKIPRAIYEPEQFPGIIYRNTNPKAVFLIFTSGKSICVGTKDIADAFAAVFHLRKLLIENDLLIPKDEGENDDDEESDREFYESDEYEKEEF